MSSDDIKITFNNNQENNKKVSVKFDTINDIPQDTKSNLINQNNKLIIDDILTEMKILENKIEKKRNINYTNPYFKFQYNNNLDNNYLFSNVNYNKQYNSSSSQIININKELDSLKKTINSNVLSKYFLNKENNFGCSFNKKNLYNIENEKYNNYNKNNNLFVNNYDNIEINEKNSYYNKNNNQVNNIYSFPSNYIQNNKLKKINAKILYNQSGFSQTDIFPNNYI